MTFLDRMERKFGWLAMPGFLRYFAIFHFGIFLIQFIRPGVVEILDFDLGLIQEGQVWRLVSFLFTSSAVVGKSPLAIVFFMFALMLMFTISDALEGAWGSFRTTVFYLTGWLCLVAANLLFGGVPFSGLVFYSSVFFAFATLFPHFELRIMMLIPVPVWLLAVISAVMMVIPVFRAPLLIVFYAIALINYFLWAGLPALRGQARMAQAAQRRRNFRAKAMPKDEAFHRCAVCGRTDVSDPALEFRIGNSGEEYCSEHLPEE